MQAAHRRGAAGDPRPGEEWCSSGFARRNATHMQPGPILNACRLCRRAPTLDFLLFGCLDI